MIILLIGNGFDIAHGYPTTYVDFLKFVRQFELFLSKDKVIEPVYNSFFSLLKQDNPDAFNELESLIKDNLLLVYFENVFADIKDKNNWIDFENELSKLIQVLDDVHLLSKKQFDNGSSTFSLSYKQGRLLKNLNNISMDGLGHYYITRNYMDIVVPDLQHGLKNVRRCLELYLALFIPYYSKEKNCSTLAPVNRVKSRVNRVLSFNYTNTFQSLYGSPDDIIEYCYIHGKAELNHPSEDCDLVLGIKEYLNDDRKDNDNTFIDFKKFYQRILFENDTKYADWIDEIEDEALISQRFEKNNYLLVYGHSLDVSDQDIIKDLILSSNTLTFIYCYKDDAKEQYIKNLVKVIGEDELKQRTKGKKRTIFFVGNIDIFPE